MSAAISDIGIRPRWYDGLEERRTTDVEVTSETNEDIEAARYGLWVRFGAVSSLLK